MSKLHYVMLILTIFLIPDLGVIFALVMQEKNVPSWLVALTVAILSGIAASGGFIKKSDDEQ